MMKRFRQAEISQANPNPTKHEYLAVNLTWENFFLFEFGSYNIIKCRYVHIPSNKYQWVIKRANSGNGHQNIKLKKKGT